MKSRNKGKNSKQRIWGIWRATYMQLSVSVSITLRDDVYRADTR